MAAFHAMDGASFQGRLLHILPVVNRQGQESADDADPKKRTLKEGGGKDFNWAALYMNVRFRERLLMALIQSGAVASSVASRLNVLNPNHPLKPTSSSSQRNISNSKAS